MSNSLVTIDTSFAVQRVSKAGKVSERGAIGVLTSGNAAERSKLTLMAIAGLIRNNTFAPLVKELARVFPASSLKAPKAKKGEVTKMQAGDVFEVNGLIFIASSETAFAQFNPAAVDAASVEALCRAIVRKHSGEEVKGEKATYLQVARAIVQHMEAKAAAKAVAAAEAVQVNEETEAA